MTIEQRLENLEIQMQNLQQSIRQMSRNGVSNTARTDTAYGKVPQVDTNTTDIQTNADDIIVTQEGLAETYEETTTAITQCEEAIAEVYEIVIGG